jgi:hypothetical protein
MGQGCGGMGWVRLGRVGCVEGWSEMGQSARRVWWGAVRCGGCSEVGGVGCRGVRWRWAGCGVMSG